AALLGARRLTLGPGRGPALAAGAVAGLLGGAFNANGPVASLYAAARGWDKRETHAALQLYFLVSGLWVVTLHGATGITSRAVLGAALLALPFLAAGAWAGWLVHRRMGEERYRRVLLLSLAAAGAVLLVAAARG
ncbi:MAG TPA: TSUP family transporter, partial [bacterium]